MCTAEVSYIYIYVYISRQRLRAHTPFTLTHVFSLFLRQDYGAAVALDVTSRTLAIGSPLANYDKLGTDEPETHDTRPDKPGARARGKVYVYYSEPAVQVHCLLCVCVVVVGGFWLLVACFSQYTRRGYTCCNAQAWALLYVCML